MAGHHTPLSLIPPHPTLEGLRRAIGRCEGCELYRNATQAVMGEGARHARLMLVGEQPGNEEDLEGRPFVGPAGRVLDRALADAGIDRTQVYVTNAVKHFKFEERGRRRLHKKPNAVEISACRPWLAAEMLVVQPEIVVCLGATAAQSLLGRGYLLTRERGKFRQGGEGQRITSTIHPSAVLRAPDEDREQMYEGLVADLKKVAQALTRAAGG
jgi:DNA polymerase